MARFISVCRADITNNSSVGSQQAIITGSTNSSGIPASTYGVVLSILASNTHASTQNVTVTLFKGGVGGTATSLVTSGVVPAQSSLEFMTGNKLVIEPDDVIKAYGSTNAVIDITVSYMLNNQDTTIT
tara:strand:+ start:1812 stop:2195 length:384 start_codon:yes stop_codon:yes gene_type:complete